MIILGIDPGTLVAGYGVVEIAQGKGRGAPRLVEFGEIAMSGKTALSSRLHKLHEKLCAVILRTHPDVCAVESAFAYKNIRSAMIIGHARGVAMLAAAQHGIPITEYSPREVKQSVTGSGAASKERVHFMVCAVLNLASPPKSFDASDALAVALCHQQRQRPQGAAARGKSGSWKTFIEEHPDRVLKPAKR